MNQVELLAPAGDFQTALAAFEAGADAVYCGLADFSARAFATNLSFEDLENLLAYARSAQRSAPTGATTVGPDLRAGRKVYVTFNTLLDEDQFDAAIETLARLEEIGPDGVIVQDLGVAKLIHDHFPRLQLHASTQLVAHNLEGVLALGELGFKRVVLARELSLEEIASIVQRCGDIELEVFIHGALCYSLSGLCLYGAMEKGRSGNRGKCPYCCRQSFKAKGRGEGEQSNKAKGQGEGEQSNKAKGQGEGERTNEAKGQGEGEQSSSVFCASLSDGRAEHLVSALPSAPKVGAKIGDEGVAETSCGHWAFQKYGDHHCSPSPSNLALKTTPSPSNLALKTTPSSFASRDFYPFSMKDLRLGEDVKKLVEAGVASLKIEGRMKSPLYVASVTRYYRQILDDNLTEGEGPESKVQGLRSKVEGPRSKVEGPRSKVEGPRSKVQDAGAERGRGSVTLADLETVFSRRTTELYLNGAPKFDESTNRRIDDFSSPIDPDSLGHLGTQIGVVKKVTRDREGRAWLRFHTGRGLEKHDGIQFEAMTEEGRHLGMAVAEMRQAISRRPVFEVNAGVDVEVLVSEDVERALRPGMKIYCSMSNAVKRLFPTPSFRPSDYAGGRAIDVEVTISKEGVSVLTRQACRSETLRLSPAKDPSRTAEGVRRAFSKLGGTGYRLGTLTVNDPEKLFVPMSVLNDLRRDLVEALDAQREKELGEKIAAAKGEDVLAGKGRRGTEPAPVGTVRRIKIRAGQFLPAGDWSEVIVAINRETSLDQLGAFKLQTFNSQPSTFNSQPSTCRLALPVYTSELAFNKLRSAVKRFLRAGYEKWEASDLATLRMLRELGVRDITADWSLYAFNARALAVLSDLGVKRFVASPENGRENLQYLAESGCDVEFLAQQSTPLFISLNRPATLTPDDSLRVFVRDGLWVTTKAAPRTFDLPQGVPTRIDLSWDD